MNKNDEWRMDELWQDVLRENLARHEANELDRAYDKHPYEFWTRNLWLWRIAMIIALCVLAWAATTDKKDRHIIVPAPAVPTTVVK